MGVVVPDISSSSLGLGKIKLVSKVKMLAISGAAFVTMLSVPVSHHTSLAL